MRLIVEVMHEDGRVKKYLMPLKFICGDYAFFEVTFGGGLYGPFSLKTGELIHRTKDSPFGNCHALLAETTLYYCNANKEKFSPGDAT